jgi:hypothetical protein
MVELDLDPQRVGNAVLARGARQRRDLDEATRELSRDVVLSVYSALLAADAGVPGQQAAVQRAVLGRLRDLQGKVADAAATAAPAPAAGAAPAELRELFSGVLERHLLFAGRERELAVLEQAAAAVRGQVGAADGSALGRYVCVSAPAGFGKSALLANWVTGLGGEQDVALAFVNRLAGTADETTVLRALCQQLLPREDRAAPLADDPADLRARLRGLLGETPKGGPSIVVVDGLDEADWLASGLFPPAPPAGRLIVLSRRASSDDWVGDLGLQRAAVTPLALGTLSAGDIASLLRAAGDPAAAFADDAAFVGAMHAVSVYEGPREQPHGDPLYVRLLVEDVREGRIRSLDDLAGQPAGLKAYFDRWWEEITAALTGPVLRDLLGYLLVAKGPIARAELVAVDDDDALDEFGRDGVPPVEIVLARARRFLVGDDDSGLALGHPRFETYLRQTRYASLTGTYSARLCEYCARWRDVHLLGPYALSHYVEHLSDRGAADERRDVLTDPRFIRAKARELGIDALLADYEEASPAAGDATVAAVGRALRRSRMALAREPEQLAAQLHGRLVGSEDAGIRRLLAGLGGAAPYPWLAARTPALASEQDLDATITPVGTVRALAFGSLGDTTTLAVGVDDRISLHDPVKGSSERATVDNDGCRVTGLCLANVDDRPVLVVAAGHDLRLFVRDATSGEEVGRSIPLPGYVDSVAVGALGDALVIAAAGNGGAWAWDAHSREQAEIATADVRGRIAGVTTLDGRVTYTLVATRDGGTPELRLVDAASLRDVTAPVFQGFAMEPSAVAVAQVGDVVLLALMWPPARCGLWSAETGDAVGPYVDMGDVPVRCLAAGDVGGRPLLAASLDYPGTGVILLREAGTSSGPTRRQRPIGDITDRPIHGLRADAEGTLTALTGRALLLQEVHADGEDTLTPLDHSPSAEQVASVLTGMPTPDDFTRTVEPGSVRLVDESDMGARGTADAERLLRGKPLQWPATARCRGVIGGRAVLAIGSYGGAVWLWDVAGRSLLAGPFADVPDELFVARRELKAARPRHVTSVAVGRSGGREILATACGGAVQLWDARTSERLPAPDVGEEVVVALALGTVHELDVLVTGSRGGVLRVRDAADGRHVAGITLDAGVDGVWVVRDAGAVAALTGDSQLHVLDLRAGSVRGRIVDDLSIHSSSR